jgi:hypothetical protein
MNSITVFLTIACIAAGLALGAIGQLYIGISFVITAVFIASVPQKANGRLPLIKRSRLREHFEWRGHGVTEHRFPR